MRWPLSARKRWRLLPTAANGQLAVAGYLWDELRGAFGAESIIVLTFTDHRVLASVGSVGDGYDNALAESFFDDGELCDRERQTRSAVSSVLKLSNHQIRSPSDPVRLNPADLVGEGEEGARRGLSARDPHASCSNG